MKKFVNSTKAIQLVHQLGEEFAVIKNPSYIYPPFEIYPLAPKQEQPLNHVSGIVMDMDGTTTTTEALCIHSLEFMTRKITDRISRLTWPGLNRLKDYPHIIGNSTTKHVEYLIKTYGKSIKSNALRRSYLEASLWFFIYGKDPGRLAEVINNLQNLGLKELLNDPHLDKMRRLKNRQKAIPTAACKYFIDKYGAMIKADNFSQIVRMAIDIYYQRYHEILAKIEDGNGEQLSQELLGESNKHLIQPMPGIGIFLALVKGWLGKELTAFASILLPHLQKIDPIFVNRLDREIVKDQLYRLGCFFQNHPAKVAVVTSSIFYEAHIVLSEVFRILYSEVNQWPLSEKRKEIVKQHFANYQNFYDGFITASDSSEIRLKPHRDLYSIALHRLGIPPSKFKQVIGFEDSESGTIAIRAAGIGRCVAVPFSETAHHNFTAATHVIKGGIPETIIKHHVFVNLGKQYQH